MDFLTYYTQQSPITDPKAYAGLLADLPRDLAGLCRVVQGLLIHYFADEKMLHYRIPKERLPEVDTRYVATMLARIGELDKHPLIEPRPPNRRLVGCCRDFATLLCAMARHQGIPARVRVGFSTYFIPGFHVDHEIVEYWDAGERRWRLVDPQLSECYITTYLIPFDPLDVPRDAFIVGGRAWQMCRTGEASAERFGLAPDSDLKGWWFIRSRLVHDVAAQNRMELLLWDAWGLMEKKPTDSDMPLRDKLALLTQGSDQALAELQAIYEQQASIKVPQVVKSYSPVASPRQVSLAV